LNPALSAASTRRSAALIAKILKMLDMIAVPDLPAEIRAVASSAQLPETYERAREALALADRLDELDDCADKFVALATYARQADDPDLENFARRIRARAVRRIGELLLEYDGRGRPKKNGTPPSFSRAEAAEAAAITPHKASVAVRLASIPRQHFEGLVEKNPAPGTTSLSQFGRSLAQVATDGPILRAADSGRISARNLIEALSQLKWNNGTDLKSRRRPFRRR
jgi:hypothetical protein